MVLEMFFAAWLGYTLGDDDGDERIKSAILQSERTIRAQLGDINESLRYNRYPSVCVEYLKAEYMYTLRIKSMPPRPKPHTDLFPSVKVENVCVSGGYLRSPKCTKEKVYRVNGEVVSKLDYAAAYTQYRKLLQIHWDEEDIIISNFKAAYISKFESVEGERDSLLCGAWGI